MAEAQLGDRARAVLDGIYRDELTAWRTLFEARANQGRATTDIAQAARAAIGRAGASRLPRGRRCGYANLPARLIRRCGRWSPEAAFRWCWQRPSRWLHFRWMRGRRGDGMAAVGSGCPEDGKRDGALWMSGTPSAQSQLYNSCVVHRGGDAGARLRPARRNPVGMQSPETTWIDRRAIRRGARRQRRSRHQDRHCRQSRQRSHRLWHRPPQTHSGMWWWAAGDAAVAAAWVAAQPGWAGGRAQAPSPRCRKLSFAV